MVNCQNQPDYYQIGRAVAALRSSRDPRTKNGYATKPPWARCLDSSTRSVTARVPWCRSKASGPSVEICNGRYPVCRSSKKQKGFTAPCVCSTLHNLYSTQQVTTMESAPRQRGVEAIPLPEKAITAPSQRLSYQSYDESAGSASIRSYQHYSNSSNQSRLPSVFSSPYNASSRASVEDSHSFDQSGRCPPSLKESIQSQPMGHPTNDELQENIADRSRPNTGNSNEIRQTFSRDPPTRTSSLKATNLHNFDPEILRTPRPVENAQLKGRIKRPGSSTSSKHSSERSDDNDPETRTAQPQDQSSSIPQQDVDEICAVAHAPVPVQSDPLGDLVTSVTPKPRPDNNDASLRTKGRRWIVAQKTMVQAGQISLNTFAIFATWWWPHYYYVFLPAITATVALNCIMVVSVIVTTIIRKTFRPEKKFTVASPESLVLLIPCYNETKEELLKSLDSLVDQQEIDSHTRSIFVICDGKVRGPGMEKTTADYLLQDIFTDYTSHELLPSAYVAWDQQYMDVVVRKGRYRGLPYICIIKQQNQGKRDGLIVVRSFLYNFNIRQERPEVIFSQRFFATMARFLLEEANTTHVDHLIGMDADTEFDLYCVSNLLKESR